MRVVVVRQVRARRREAVDLEIDLLALREVPIFSFLALRRLSTYS